MCIVYDQITSPQNHLDILYICFVENVVIAFKVLFHEPDGYVLLYKRLDVIQGKHRWSRNKSEVRSITWQQFDWLMSGLEIEQPKALTKEN